MEPAAFGLSVVFFAWIALTLVNQFDTGYSQAIRRFDFCGAVPLWTFFAPRPGIHDYYLLIQDSAEELATNNWVQIIGPRSNPATRFLWHPYKWESKAIADMMQQLAQLRRITVIDSKTLMLTSSYLLLLEFALAHPCESGASCRRFALARKQGRLGELEVVLVSDFHPLPLSGA